MLRFYKNSESLIIQAIAMVVLLPVVASSSAQSATAAETVRNYSIAQKRLLVINTALFANALSQNTLDRDSVMAISHNITGMPFLLPYNETFPGGRITAVTKFVNSGRLPEAKTVIDPSIGDMRIQGLLEIALWYLHQEGTDRQDLDSASRFIQLALTASLTAGSSVWQDECIIQSAELHYQQGNMEQSSLILSRLATTALHASKPEITARAYMGMADLLWPTDTSKENLYYKSLDIYRSLGLKEKQIELLWKIALCHELRDFSLAEKDLREIINISNNIGFKHTLYAQNRLAYVLYNTGNYLVAIEYARAALGNMNWSGLSEVQGAFYIRMGISYLALGNTAETVQWLNKALATATTESQMFWYKSLPILTGVYCFDMKRPGMALSLIDSVNSIFPPITIWEKMQWLTLVGICNELLKRPKLADTYFTQLLALANANPLADPYGEMFGDYIYISQLYVLRRNLPMARRFLKLALVKERDNADALSLKYSLYYKMDSLEGKYKSALQNHIKYKLYFDSSISTDQRKRMDELNVKYAAEKKDQNIKLLQQQGVAQQAELKQNRLTKNIMIAGAGMLLFIVILLYNQFRLKQRSNAAMNSKNLALQRLVDEKEWLLKEVHHRVKNNLHTVISLLESQASYLENDALKAIEKSQHRIYAMSLIHQKLYQTEDIKTIDMSVYLPEFVNYLDESFGTHSYINFQLTIEPLKFGVSQAIPIALIINEAVTNSIKYAFPDNRKGTIIITMHRIADQVKLIIADNGIGIDPSFVNKTFGTLGLKLIRGLSEDIQGSLTIKNELGTRISIVFNIDPLNESTIILPATTNQTAVA